MQKEQTYRIIGKLNQGINEVDALLASGQTDLSIDFSACTFISVEGLEWLEEMLMRAASYQANVRFINIPSPLYKTFKVAHIDNILEACGASTPTPRGTTTC